MSLGAALIALKSWISEKPFLHAIEDPREAQERLLETIGRRNRDTGHGRRHGFGEVRDQAGYRRKVPLVHYGDISESIGRMTRGEGAANDLPLPGSLEASYDLAASARAGSGVVSSCSTSALAMRGRS